MNVVLDFSRKANETQTLYWKGKETLPVFEWTKSKKDSTRRDQKKLEDILSTLIHNYPKEKICTSKPVSVDRNCSFIVDTNCLNQIDDLFADDCGAWICTGSPKYFFEERRSQETVTLKRVGRGKDVKVKNLKKPWYEVVLYYHKNKSSPDFKRTITIVKGK